MVAAGRPIRSKQVVTSSESRVAIGRLPVSNNEVREGRESIAPPSTSPRSSPGARRSPPQVLGSLQVTSGAPWSGAGRPSGASRSGARRPSGGLEQGVEESFWDEAERRPRAWYEAKRRPPVRSHQPLSRRVSGAVEPGQSHPGRRCCPRGAGSLEEDRQADDV